MSSRSNRRQVRRIPIDQVHDGIDLAMTKALTNLRSAETLLATPECVNDAGLLTMHALEEIGKACILRDRLEQAENNGNDFIQVGGRSDDFYSHPAKINAALNEMPAELRTLAMGTFDPSQQFFQTGSLNISQDLKEHITYTEFGDTGWISPHTLNPDHVRNLIRGLREIDP